LFGEGAFAVADVSEEPRLELLIDLPPDGPRGKAVEDAIRAAIGDGRLAAGVRLPSTRDLSVQLGLSRGTINAAYTQLTAEGWLTAQTGSGTRVADQATTMAPAPPRDPLAAWVPKHDLAPGRPDISNFPRRAWAKALREAVTDAPTEALGYGDPRGRIELRTTLSAYLGRVRGVHVAPEHLVICSGFAQGLAVVTDVFAAAGVRSVGMENPAMADHVTTVSQRMRVVDIPVDRDGMVVEELERSAAGAAVCTPAHQFPTGVALSPSRRAALLAWARQAGAYVVEDDYDGEFRYEGRTLPALQSRHPAHTVYVGSTSKTLGPAVRLGWIACPSGLLADVVEAKRLADRQTSPVEQLALAALIDAGEYDRYLQQARRAYRGRRDRLLALVEERLPGVRVRGVDGGLHAILELPGTLGEREVVAALREVSVRVHPFGNYVRGDGGGAGVTRIVLGYATPPAHGYSSAISALVEALRRL
jgi:GntR family transcriptional regulator/MocR family aminotransferase